MKIYKSGNYSEPTITDLCILKKDNVFTNCVFEKTLFFKNVFLKNVMACFF